MPIPSTTGSLKTKISHMEIGDYIKLSYNNVAYVIGENGQTEYPVTGSTTSVLGWMYLIKVDKGLLISDRVFRHTISWDVLNNAKWIQGNSVTLDGITGIIRGISGGVAYANPTTGAITTDSTGSIQSAPINNEWDKYINLSTLNGKVTAGDNNVWHWSGIYTWTQDTPILGLAAVTTRTIRGNTFAKTINWVASSTSNSTHGFRPVFEYTE